MALDTNQQFGPLENVNISQVPNSDKKHNYRMIIITVIVILIGIGGFIVSQNENLQQLMKNSITGKTQQTGGSASQGPVEVVESTIADPNIAWLKVQPEKPTYTQSDTVVININAFSEGKDITGYDMLLKIDPEMYELKSVSSAIAGFTVFPFERGTYIAVTGIKDIGTKEPTIFTDTPILKMELTPKKKGTSIIGVNLTEGKEKTQLIDADVNVIVPQIGSAQVEVN